ncbi:MAG: cellobiose phosphorylase, partial [Candidatus Omnitrophica bacterium]|nr:cellobiose phosphorylase [Candidatus Omnitrophota bacterium]
MKERLWEFTDNYGTFKSGEALNIKGLYLPLCNNHPMMSSISADLHGDLKTGYDNFLLEPASRISLTNSKSSRNFWIYLNQKCVWSATGVSKDLTLPKKDEFILEGGLSYQRIERSNKKIGLKATITSFIPSGKDPLEIMLIDIDNISKRAIEFIPTAAIPLFGRSANNLHDHRHVTSLLNRVKVEKYGVILTPALAFNEAGHNKNRSAYFVLGYQGNATPPEYIYPTQDGFTGEDSDLEAPQAVYRNTPPADKFVQGKEAMAGLKFRKTALFPGRRCSYAVLMGVSADPEKIKAIFDKYSGLKKIRGSLDSTREYWKSLSSRISVKSHDHDFDNWLRWVSIQPVLRKIFGCSFLPDFDYGKGGRGWRDLWQDCLSLILIHPEETKDLLINNFAGVRIDGSNATVIGKKPGEFIADRNNISRVWMDHGAWPLITTGLYINQTSDLDILFKQIPYFRNHELCRGRVIDAGWSNSYGKSLKDKSGRVYRGTILEHLLVENLVQFFNVGDHNNIRLENADWNDGLDMAYQNGESVAFTAMYAANLNALADLIIKTGKKTVSVLKELRILIEASGNKKISYSSAKEKKSALERYFSAVKFEVSGEKVNIASGDLAKDLKKKACWIHRHIQEKEWLKEGFFNGYYDNDARRVEGTAKGRVRMTLTGQVFAIMSGIASPEQISLVFKNSCKYLRENGLGGFRLNTDFKEERLNLGRAFSFAYGDKEK